MIKTLIKDVAHIILNKDKEKIKDYLSDESNIITGFADEVIFANNEDEVIKAIIEANSKRKRLTISGAGTGITGSRVPLGGAVISLENFTRIERIPKENEELVIYREFDKEYSIILGKDEKSYYAILPPAIPIRILKKIVEDKGLFYPPDPTETSSFIGGNVATNASGARTFKYGSTRDYVRRLRIVLPFGDILDVERGRYFFVDRKLTLETSQGKIELELPSYNMPPVEKNAAGYYVKDNMDLIDLFIGSEGTLGVFTEIEVKLIKKPSFISAVFAYFEIEDKAIDFAKKVRREAKNSRIDVLAIEFFDSNSLSFIRDKYGNRIPKNANALIDLEIEGDNEEDLEKNFEKILEISDEYGGEAYIIDVSEAKEIRHSLPAGVNNYVRIHGTKKVATDIAVPEENFDKMYKFYHEVGINSGIKYVLFGHIGNFHLHFNFLPRNQDELTRAEKYIVSLWKKAIELNGTVSAEHGVGKKYYVENSSKKPLISLMYDKNTILNFANLKKKLDPNLILNIGNIIPEEYFNL
ncbi:MAG TPA: FAD-binding oxidoreductase [Geobacterales bacterium]|nr:FAD-binding oxidoreductase [Geobacterales bacterium]